MERSPWAFAFFYILFLPPTPNPLINALKPTHCAGWVASSYLPFIWVSLFKDRVVAMEAPLQLLHLNLWVLHLRALKEQKGSGLFFGSESEPRIDDGKC